MQFAEADLDAMLAAVGEPFDIILDGVKVKDITAKFRKDFLAVSPYETNLGKLEPALMCKTSVLADVTTAHVFRRRFDGVDYKFDGKPEDKPSGLTLVHLGVKK